MTSSSEKDVNPSKIKSPAILDDTSHCEASMLSKTAGRPKVLLRPVATGGIRGQCPPIFLCPHKFCCAQKDLY